MSRQSRTPGLSAFAIPPPSTSSSTNNTTSSSSFPKTTTTSNPHTRATLYTTYGTTIRASQLDALQTQLSVFRALLHNFALVHAVRIRKDKGFRAEFVRMCEAVGVDPFSETVSKGGGGGNKSGILGEGNNNNKRDEEDGGIWDGDGSEYANSLLPTTNAQSDPTPSKTWLSSLLPTTLLHPSPSNPTTRSPNDRTIELSLRVVETCRSRRAIDGGLTPLSLIRDAVARGTGRGYAVGGEMAGVTEGDIEGAVKGLEVLGAGFGVLEVGRGGIGTGIGKKGGGRTGGMKMVRSVARGLSEDQGTVMEAVQVLGFVTGRLLRDNFGWTGERVEAVCGDLVAGGLVWVDDQGDGGREFWGTGGLRSWEED